MKNFIFTLFFLYTSIVLTAQKTSYDFLAKGQEKMYSKKPADYKGAIKDFSEAIKIDPQMAEAYWERGNAYSMCLDYQNGINDFGSAISKYNSNDVEELSELYCNRGINYYKIHNDQQSLSDFEFAEKNGCTHGELFYTRSKIYLGQQNYKNAKEDLQKALPFFQNKKDNKIIFEIYHDKSLCEYELHQIDLAVKSINKAIEIDPNNYECYMYRGIYYLLKEYNYKSLDDLNQAIKLKQNDIRSLYVRGYLNYFYFENRIEAKKDFDKIIEIDYNNTFKPLVYLCYDNYSGYENLLKIAKENKQQQRRDFYFDVARIYSLKFNEANAINYLDSALSYGYANNNRIMSDPDLKNIRYTQSFKDMLSKHKIPYVVKQPADNVLNKINYSRTLSSELPELAIALTFEEPSGNKLLDGNETAAINANVTNIGKGIAWSVYLALSENNNNQKIKFDKLQGINKIMPGQTIDVKFKLKAPKDIYELLNFKVETTTNYKGKVIINLLDIRTKPFLDLNTASMMNPDSITSLDLSENGLTELPQELAKFKNLRYLNLSNNRLVSIDNLPVFKNLRFLDISNNVIGILPASICELKELEEVNAENNQIKSIPSGFPNLVNLKILNLGNNKLTEFNTITNCKNLIKLNLGQNNISQIPDDIIQMNNLKEISLKSCPIAGCSPNFYKLKNINLINLEGVGFFSGEHIIDVRVGNCKAQSITFTEPNKNISKVIDPVLSKDYSRILDLWNKYHSDDYKAILNLADYFDSYNQKELAGILYDKAVKNAKIDNYSSYEKLGNYIDDRGYPSIAENAYLETQNFPIQDYNDRMLLAYNLCSRNYTDIAKWHYEKVVNDYNITNDKVVFEIALFLETDRGLYDLATKMYEKIAYNPEFSGTGRGLLAKKSIADLCERHPDFNYSKTVFDIHNEICSSTPLDEKALVILQSSCKKCWEIMNKEVLQKERVLEKKNKTLEQLAQSSATTKKVGSFAGLIGNVGSSIPGMSVAGTAIQTGSQIAGNIQDNVYEQNKMESENLKNEIVKLKNKQRRFIENVPVSVAANHNNYLATNTSDYKPENKQTTGNTSTNSVQNVVVYNNMNQKAITNFNEYYPILPGKAYVYKHISNATWYGENKPKPTHEEYYYSNTVLNEAMDMYGAPFYKNVLKYSKEDLNKYVGQSWTGNVNGFIINYYITYEGEIRMDTVNPKKQMFFPDNYSEFHYNSKQPENSYTKKSQTFLISKDTSIFVNEVLYKNVFAYKSVDQIVYDDFKKNQNRLPSEIDYYYAKNIGLIYYKYNYRSSDYTSQTEAVLVGYGDTVLTKIKTDDNYVQHVTENKKIKIYDKESKFNAKDIFIKNQDIYFYGLDFSNARFIGPNFNNKQEIKDTYFKVWNDILVSESKYDLKAPLRKSNVYVYNNVAASVNKDADPSTFSDNYSEFSTEALSKMVGAYECGNNSGIGLSFIVEAFDWNKNKSFVYIVFFDLDSRKILLFDKMEGIPGGMSSIRNYWINSIANIIEVIKSKRYVAWENKYKTH